MSQNFFSIQNYLRKGPVLHNVTSFELLYALCYAIKYCINVTNVVIHLSLQTEHIYPSISTNEEIRLIW